MPRRNSEWLNGILSRIDAPINIDKICAAFTHENAWPPELLSPDICQQRAQKAYARQVLENFKTEENVLIPRYVNLRDEQKLHFWKAVDQLTENDLRQKIEYCEKLIRHYRGQLREYRRRKQALIAAQLGLPFGEGQS